MRSGVRPSYTPWPRTTWSQGLSYDRFHDHTSMDCHGGYPQAIACLATLSLTGRGRIEKGGLRDEGPVASGIGVPPL